MGVVKKLAQLTYDTPDPELFDSQDDCSNLDLLPLSSTQVQLKGICGRQSPGEENYDVLAQHCTALPEDVVKTKKTSTTFLALYKKQKMTACTKSQKGSREWSCRILCTAFRDTTLIREIIPSYKRTKAEIRWQCAFNKSSIEHGRSIGR